MSYRKNYEELRILKVGTVILVQSSEYWVSGCHTNRCSHTFTD